jgi:tetratricopeptide (TPR) repeat protein
MALEVLSLGIAAWQMGKLEEARDWFEEARRLFAEIDNHRGVAQAELQLGHTALWEGKLTEARRHFAQANDTIRVLGLEPTRAGAQLGMALLSCLEGDLVSARSLLIETAALQEQTPGLRHAFTMIFETGARIAALSHEYARAAMLLGATETARRLLAYALSPIERPKHEEVVQLTLSALGEEGVRCALCPRANPCRARGNRIALGKAYSLPNWRSIEHKPGSSCSPACVPVCCYFANRVITVCSATSTLP